MIGAAPWVLLAAASVPSAGGFSPVQRFDGLDHEAIALRPAGNEVLVLPRWNRNDGARVSLDGRGVQHDGTLPGCGLFECAVHASGALLHVDPGGVHGEQTLQRLDGGAAPPQWTQSLGPAFVLGSSTTGDGIQVLLGAEWSAQARELVGLGLDGTVAWRRDLPDLEAQLASTPTLVLLWTANTVHVIDPSTGATQREVELRGGIVEVADATADALVVAIRRGPQARLQRRDRGGGQVWSVSAPPISAIHIVDDKVLACTSGGNVVAHRLVDGKAVWSYGLGHRCAELWSVPVPAADPERFLAAGPHGRFTVFEADASPPAAERYTARGRVLVDGRPIRGVTVSVGDRRVRTDAKGRYRVRAQGRGTVTIRVDLPESPRPGRVLNFHPAASIELSGKRSYRRDLVTHTVFDDH